MPHCATNQRSGRCAVACARNLPGLCHSGWVADFDVDAASCTVPASAVHGAVAGIEDLDDLPVAEHVARFDAVHRALSDALSTIDGA